MASYGMRSGGVVEVDGCSYVFRSGQTVITKPFATEEEAIALYVKVVAKDSGADPAELTAKLRREGEERRALEKQAELALDEADARLPPRIAENPELEAAIEANPSSDAAWLAYGEWLRAQGDPRGLIIAVEAALRAKPNNVSLLRDKQRLQRRYSKMLYGDLKLEGAAFACIDAEWRFGLAVAAKLKGPETAAALKALGSMSTMRFLRSLTIEGAIDVFDCIAKAGLPRTLRELTMTGPFFERAKDFWRACEHIESLTLHTSCPGHLGEVELPSVRSFEWCPPDGLNPYGLGALAVARWPHLESLRLDFAGLGGDFPPEIFPQLFARDDLTMLRTLELRNCYAGRELLRALMSSPMLGGLRDLSLTGCRLDDGDADEIVSRASSFAHLSSFDLSRNALSKTGRARLAKLPNVSSSEQNIKLSRSYAKPAAPLSPKVVAQIARLGGALPERPAKTTVPTANGPLEIRTSLAEFLAVKWPEGTTFTESKNDFDHIAMELSAHHEVDSVAFAYTPNGFFAVLRLDDPKPADPEVHWVDHGETIAESDSMPLSKFLATLSPE